MPHFPKLGPAPPIGTPLDSPEWLAWKSEIARWYADVLDTWAIEGFRQVAENRQAGGSVPTVLRRR